MQQTNVIHPEKPSAVGSRNSLNRSSRDEYKESKYVIDEEVDKILNHISSKLPPEVLSKLHIGNSIKELVHNYFNQGFQNMLNRYLTTVEDEMAKKVREFVDVNEQEGLNKHTPVSIPDLLNRIGGEEKFNSAEIEKSTVNIYGHLQGHIQRGQYELEQDTNSLLRQKIDIGSFVRGENIHSIIKCVFKDSLSKPETVTDISLSINIIDSDLISEIYHYQNSASAVLGYLISDTIFNHLDKEMQKINYNLLDQGKTELTNNEAIFEKLKAVENSFNINGSSKNLGRITNTREMRILGNRIVEVVKGIPIEISKFFSDPISVKDNVVKLLESESVRNRGYNTAVNSITAILDTSRMGYQFIENNKNARRLTIREYEDMEEGNLPDEKYSIHMHYLDSNQLREIRIAYAQQMSDFENKVTQVWDVCNSINEEVKRDADIIDYDDVKTELLKNDKKGIFSRALNALGVSDSDDDEDEYDQVWNEITFIQPDESDVEKANSTFKEVYLRIDRLFVLIREKMGDIFKRSYPLERICVEERTDSLEMAFNIFYQDYNPFHCQSGLNFQINISTIKRKKTTMKSMSNVLNEFLYGVSKEFQDQAFADYSRRRSTDSTGDYKDFVSHDSKTIDESALKV